MRCSPIVSAIDRRTALVQGVPNAIQTGNDKDIADRIRVMKRTIQTFVAVASAFALHRIAMLAAPSAGPCARTARIPFCGRPSVAAMVTFTAAATSVACTGSFVCTHTHARVRTCTHLPGHAISLRRLVVWWGIERHAPYAWVLQDILGIAFMISTLQSLRTPSFRVG